MKNSHHVNTLTHTKHVLNTRYLPKVIWVSVNHHRPSYYRVWSWSTYIHNKSTRFMSSVYAIVRVLTDERSCPSCFHGRHRCCLLGYCRGLQHVAPGRDEVKWDESRHKEHANWISLTLSVGPLYGWVRGRVQYGHRLNNRSDERYYASHPWASLCGL